MNFSSTNNNAPNRGTKFVKDHLVPQRSRRRRKIKTDRLESRKSVNAFQSRRISSYQLCTDSDLEKIEEQADWLLENVGMEFRGDEEALELFRDAGATINHERITFEPGLVRSLCATAPSTFTLHSRNSNRSIGLGADHVVFMPGYGSPFVTDLERGRRYATIEDFRNFVKLTYSTPYMHHSGGTIVEPVDVPVNKRHLGVGTSNVV